MHPVHVSQRKREIQDQAKKLFEGKRGPQPVSAHSAPDMLYGEIGRLKMELDWLKKSQGSAHSVMPFFLSTELGECHVTQNYLNPIDLALRTRPAP